MNRSIRRVGYGLILLILVLVGQLTYLQVVDANKLENDPRNVRHLLDAYNRHRGEILTADGQIVAQSNPTTGDFKYQRVYPQGALFAEISGYQSFAGLVGNTGVEASYDKVMTGRDSSLRFSNLGDVVSGKLDTANVVLAATKSVQQVAHDALGDQKGSVVALDVKTGAVVAMYSNPTYDPNTLAIHDTQAVQNAFNFINAPASGNAALQRAYREIYPPGSTFKVVTTKSALETGTAQPDTQFPAVQTYQIPGTTTQVSNFNGEVCGGSLVDSLVQSCNTTFAKLGYDMGSAFAPQIEQCGIGDRVPIDLDPASAPTAGPTASADRPRFSLAGFGQGDVFVSALQMALVAEAVANNGVILTPHVAGAIQDADGKTVRTIGATPWKTCMSAQTAASLTQMMVSVVDHGTGTAAQIPGVAVAGKTGTAQNGTADQHLAPHAWFIAFAPANAPRYAVAVIVPNGGSNNNPEVTGGAVAAPIARQVLQALLAPR